MALRKIILKNDPILRKKSREVTEISDRIRALADDMWETLYDANGVGLAAPQVGALRRLVVIDVTSAAEDEEAAEDADKGACSGTESASEPVKYVLVNPEIIEVSEETVRSIEGCLSVPGYTGVVERPAWVKIRALDLDGNPFVVEGRGMLAKALFHEIDHLDGVLYIDLAESVEPVSERSSE